MGTIAVSGVHGHLGGPVLDALGALGRRDVVDLDGDVAPRLDGVSTVVHLGDVPDTRRLLAAADRAGVATVVLLSSATVYGAWAGNPVPLPEVAPLRPNPGASWPTDMAERERVLSDWRDAAAGTLRRTVVLRPATIVDGAHIGGPARRLAGLGRVRVRGTSRPVQAVHARDVAAAVALAVEGDDLEGVYNVAPDGWVADETARALVRVRPRLALPTRIARACIRLPAGLLPYTVHPWVVANDRLRATGWTPTFTNEETLLLA